MPTDLIKPDLKAALWLAIGFFVLPYAINMISKR